jgi:hypothetical protein
MFLKAAILLHDSSFRTPSNCLHIASNKSSFVPGQKQFHNMLFIGVALLSSTSCQFSEWKTLPLWRPCEYLEKRHGVKYKDYLRSQRVFHKKDILVFWEQKDRLRALSAKDTVANRTCWALRGCDVWNADRYSMWPMIITGRQRSDVVMDLDSKVNKSTLKLTINSDLSHKWLYAWLRHNMQYELGESPSRFVSLEGDCQHGGVSPQSNPRSPKTMRSFTPSYCGPCSKSRLNTYEHALSACRISATIEDEPVEKVSLAQTWHGCILASLLQLDNELLSKRTRNWLRKNPEPSAPRSETRCMLRGCHYQRKPV